MGEDTGALGGSTVEMTGGMSLEFEMRTLGMQLATLLGNLKTTNSAGGLGEVIVIIRSL
jgi:hypothetical protein